MRSSIRTSALIAMLALITIPTLFAHADVRDTLRGAIARPSSPIPATPTPPPALPTPPAPQEEPQGGITNTTSGEVDSGGNQGGTVTTGDEHVEVQVVNVGPVNSNNTQVTNSGGQEDPAPEEPACSTDRRASNPCPVDSGTRAR